MERDTGIEPAIKLWESFVMPFHQSRLQVVFYCFFKRYVYKVQLTQQDEGKLQDYFMHKFTDD